MKYYVNKNFEKSYDGKYHNFFIVNNGTWVFHSEDYDEKHNSWKKCGEYIIISPMITDFLKEIKEEETTFVKKDIKRINFVRM